MPELIPEKYDVFEIEEAPEHASPVLEVSEDEPSMHTPETIMVDEPEELVPGSEAPLRDKVDEQKADAPKEMDWLNDKEHSKFPAYFDAKLKAIPKHSGETIPGCERAKFYLKDLLRELSSAARSDVGAKVDEMWSEKQYQEINKMIARLDQQLEVLQSKNASPNISTRLVAEGNCEKCATIAPMWHDTENDKLICLHCEAEVEDNGVLSKTAGTPVLNVFMTPFERAIVSTMINSSVSAGRNIEESYEHLKNKYNFTPREELAIQQLITDYGYPLLKDRARLNEPHDPADGSGIDFSTSYHS